VVKTDNKENSDAGRNWRKIKEGVSIKHVPYPHTPSKREVERQFIKFTKILKNLQINIPFIEALHTTKKRKFPEEEKSGIGGRLQCNYSKGNSTEIL